MNALLDTSLVGGPFLIGLYALAALCAAGLLLRRLRVRTAALTLILVLAGALVGWVLVWLVSDIWDLFGVSMSTPTRLWTAGLVGALVLAVTNLFGARPRRRVLAVVAIPLFLLTAAAGINAEFGQFNTVRAALGIPLYGALTDALSGPVPPITDTRGTVGTVTIPATVSGFAARPAMVYLPAAARSANPPVLPVIEMLSGQPGSPSDLFTAGRLAGILDAWAATHHGLAPIVVVPDQLGAPDRNPMCVDSKLGNSASYLTMDVPAWIRGHYRVAAAPDGWAIGGFSQGGTCSIQLGAAHPELYGTVLDISGELAPKAGNPQQTVQAGFAGSAAAYAAAAPSAILAAHAPYQALHIIFAVGGDDTRYIAWTNTLKAAAERAGATTDLLVSPGTAHDWHTVVYALTRALPLLAAHTELTVNP
ncbi:enterochelin esterase-like enzyme [Cryobacterium sp. MP_M5]|uniref:alpha/beta hydrolase n=1 Tax=unclassified Cryobacterium TaxID=2649013 RepID=UPI0018CB0D8A|nr:MULTISPECIES: alpha/beta hydrolase-fold protein [unclassified Cryobacterium]MBG6058300.1 enterochelin esterase-like enzyme [Cryobacterium sp. MP_M3]MEC5177707.1 enterochelin esterase-like enzyme [Cryobacterium sp. MP_M5]